MNDTADSQISGESAYPGAPRTVAEALGQVVWLLSQSPLHRQMKLKDLEWSFMPAILKEQFRIFRFGPLPTLAAMNPTEFKLAGFSKEGIEQLPLGVAIWAHLSEAAEAKLERGEHLDEADWQSGDRLWVVEFVTPFATTENKLGEAMMLDLMGGPLSGKTFYLHRTDPQSGRRDKVKLSGLPAKPLPEKQ
ncbi:toxin-activating lysine-acyltransferase [Luteimonas sp. RD2P54]|uniref:RTX toxin-activating lysine-acyltransferase n=1 Tax=Luteimonas endophytica TaxID=3042023 RepID=A0ABT6J6S3_9GAMM|nr:toxin-activating lysine-acyltransferase [Luteimonas endophytica]MDH5822290.1 toxin-activating lysine-acyltransferase [Luteimonas endophytica]